MVRRFFSRTPSIAVAFAVLAATQATGCAVIEKQETKSTEQLLSASGFNIRSADTPEKLASLQAMKQHRLFRHQAPNGEMQFLWADAAVCRCLYVGDQQAYQQFQALKVQQQIADANEEAALDASMASPWPYNWWGPPYY